jgi:hypothetical protein
MGRNNKPRPPLFPEPREDPPFGDPRRRPWPLNDDPPTKTAAAINRDLPEIIRKAKDEAVDKAAREKASRGGNASGKKRREVPSPNPIMPTGVLRCWTTARLLLLWTMGK